MKIFLEPMTYQEWENTSSATNDDLGLKEYRSNRSIEYYEVIDKRKFFLAVIKYNLRYKILSNDIIRNERSEILE